MVFGAMTLVMVAQSHGIGFGPDGHGGHHHAHVAGVVTRLR